MADLNLPNPTSGDSSERTFGVLAHVLAIFTFFVGPLVIWLVKKDESQFISEHAKESLNFQIWAGIGYVISSALICFIIGYFLWLAVWVVALVFQIQGAMAANRGEMYRYPFNIRLIK